MKGSYSDWYEEFREYKEVFGEDELVSVLDQLLRSSRNTFAMNRRLMEKAIDVSWVEAIENGLVHLDNVLRNPSRTIEDVEEIVPIALSRKITVESVRHLAQHTDLIQSIDKKTGKITPSKILNIHKEESMATYENRFINTLVDRLYIFINTRYEKLAQVARDEQVYSLGYDTSIDDGAGGKMKVSLKIETTDSLDSYDASGFTVWQRVEKLKKAIEGYKGSELCMTLGSNYVRPPIMRTNAIMKNVELKACLTLWQYIESYDKVGYEINVEDTAVKPDAGYMEDVYRLVVLNLLLFRAYTETGKEPDEELGKKKFKAIQPKIVKRFGKEVSGDYSIQTDAAAGYIASEGGHKLRPEMPSDVQAVFQEVNTVIEIERAYLAEREAERQKAEQLRVEEEKRLEEQKRIEEARQAELERIRQKEEEERQHLAEMLRKKREEQEAEERERERLEAERQARLEELRKREEEERLRREEEERIAAERERVDTNKSKMRAELGEAEGIDTEAISKAADDGEEEKRAYEQVTEAEIEEVKAAMEESEEQFEDPRAVAARQKLEQQKREKERRETERAQRLKVERTYFESKPFREIYKEYSHNPIYAIPRLIRWILAMVFGIIPEDTDNPGFKAKRKAIEDEKARKELEKQKREAMEVYYRKYAHTVKYDFMRWIGDIKFKRRRRKQMKSRPKPKYTPPVRTPEEQKAIDTRMKQLYKEYHVSAAEKVKRKIDERLRERRSERNRAQMEKIRSQEIAAQRAKENGSEDEGIQKISRWIATIILIAAAVFTGYVMICTARGAVVSVFGKSVLRVVTGSMEPSLHVGDNIYVEKVDTDTLKTGDIISFYSEQSDIYGMLVTHRIAEVGEDGSFVTKGDANDVTDSVTVSPDRVVGKYIGKARFFNWVATFGDSRKLIMILVIIPFFVMTIYEMRSVAKLGQKVQEEKKLSEEERRAIRIREEIEKEKERLRKEGYDPDKPEKDESETDDSQGESPEDGSTDEPEEAPSDENEVKDD